MPTGERLDGQSIRKGWPLTTTRRVLLGCGLGILLSTGQVVAQPAGGIATIGVLNLAPENPPVWWVDALRKGLLELGWVEGRTFRLVSRSAEGKIERLPSVAADLVALKVDVIVTAGTTSIRAARDATRTIPIVMAAGADPVTMGFAASLARPGGNVTGLSILGGDILVKRIELLKEAVPRATRVGVLLQRANPGNAAFLKEIREAAPKLKVSVDPVEVSEPREFEKAFATMTAGGVNAAMVLEDPIFSGSVTQLLEAASRQRLPVMWGNRRFVESGGLMAYGLVYEDLWWRAAGYVDKILKGAKPGDLPVEQPTKFELVINLKTARALGLTISQSLWLRADRVIE